MILDSEIIRQIEEAVDYTALDVKTRIKRSECYDKAVEELDYYTREVKATLHRFRSYSCLLTALAIRHGAACRYAMLASCAEGYIVAINMLAEWAERSVKCPQE